MFPAEGGDIQLLFKISSQSNCFFSALPNRLLARKNKWLKTREYPIPKAHMSKNSRLLIDESFSGSLNNKNACMSKPEKNQ